MRLISTTGGSALYECPHDGPARVLLCSTDPSRRLLTDPAVSGHRYRLLVRSAVAEALTAWRGDAAGERWLGSGQPSVVTILRGGLSFGLEEAVVVAGGADADVSFVGTERAVGEGVRTTYERWEFGAGPAFVGDILATGGTLRAVLSRLRDAATRRGVRPAAVVLVVIGSAAGVDAVQRFVADWDAADRPDVTMIALEALYDVPASGTVAPFARHPFDLLRTVVGSTPEYESARLSSVDSLFERCAVYDGGVRAFTPSAHADERAGWWAGVLRRKVPLAVLGAHTAGLADYRLAPEQWRRRLRWSGQSGVDLDLVYELGRRALRYAETTATADHVHDRLAEGTP
ncbi:phosphoribosyltransferase [Micromonospora sp. NPDC092111]|uniref:phosphoribosyltransferase n=1 Tax=Micromonospora sp. NPDC092111 TaxID=3364289 RepID=UPI0038303818